MLKNFLIFVVILILSSSSSYSQWIDISNINIKKETTESSGSVVFIEYELNDSEISSNTPAYVFMRYSKDGGKNWNFLPMSYLKGNGHNIIETQGRKSSVWWGTEEIAFQNLDNVKFKVKGIKMISVPSGEFIMNAVPGGGHDNSKSGNIVNYLPLFYMAKFETTISMYIDYLNEVGGDGIGYDSRMLNEIRCGIIQEGSSPNFTYKAVPGKENYPITYVSFYDAEAFLNWCGLRLPSEAEFEKAFRGGKFLDGDESRKVPNPIPDRKYPWGNESPDEGGVYRCNFEGDKDGFAGTSPVGIFSKFNSPYGICDLAGNVAEWTLDWYSTSFHVGIDGYRMVRGGSWMALPVAVDAITGATQLPNLKRTILGFRAAK